MLTPPPPTPASAPSPGGPKYHPFHDSPLDTILLRSSEHMLFRVWSYRLLKASAVFEDMFDSANPSETPIDVNVPSRVVEMFLNAINSSDPIITAEGKENIKDAFDLLSISRLFECEPAKQRALRALNGKYRYKEVYWSLLVEASSNNDIELGRLLLKSMRRPRLEKFESSYTTGMDSIWERAILNGLFGEEYVASTDWLPFASPDTPRFSDVTFIHNEKLSNKTRIPSWIKHFNPYRDHEREQARQERIQKSQAERAADYCWVGGPNGFEKRTVHKRRTGPVLSWRSGKRVRRSLVV